MKSKLFFMLLLGSLSLLSVQAQERSIEFEQDSWATILAKAKKQNKLIFLDAYTSWCRPCKWMAANVFTVNEVADLFNTHFICAKIDMEKGEGVELAKKYEIQAYPTLLFINAQGEVVHCVVGAINQHMLVKQGLQAMNPYENLRALTKRFEEGEREADFMKDYLEILSLSGEKAGELFEAYFENLDEEARQTDVVFEMINTHVQDKETKAATYLFTHREAYAKVVEEKRVATKIINLYTNRMMQALRIYDDKAYADTRKEALSLRVKGMEAELIKIDMYRAKVDNNWVKATKLGDELFEEHETESAELMNDLAWDVYASTDDKRALESALGWAQRSIELDSKANNNETAAALLFKLGKYKEAKPYAEKALELAKAEGLSDLKGFENTLDKINEALK